MSPSVASDTVSISRPIARAPLLRVANLCKYYPLQSGGVGRKVVGEIKAVDDVTFDVLPGDTFGIVGESGSGKTTTARCLVRAIAPTSGRIEFSADGQTVDLAPLEENELRRIRPKMQMVFQDVYSSLNPRMSVGDIIAEPLVVHGRARGSELTDRVEAMLHKVGLKPEHRLRYPHAFSGGQRQRIGIARALILQPSLVVADEAVSALDVSVQAQIINLLQDLQAELKLTYVFVAHDLSVVRHFCNRIAVMYAGRIVELAETEALFEDAKHPYTRALVSAIPSPDPRIKMTPPSEGEPANPVQLPPGCSFHPRCPHRFAPCDRVVPALQELPDGLRRTACHFYSTDPLPS